MALNEKNAKAIESDPELQAKIKELWDRDAPVSDFYDLLTAAGLDVTLEDIADTHAELQKRRGEAIADLEHVDLEQLRKVAGGGASGKGGCGSVYYVEQCSATVEEGSLCWSNDWCMSFSSIYS